MGTFRNNADSPYHDLIDIVHRYTTRRRGFKTALGRFPGEGNGNPLYYSCLGNSMDGGAWWATVHGVAKSWTQLSY